MKLTIKLFFSIAFFWLSFFVQAETNAEKETAIEFKVIALFKNAAMIQHEQKQKLLRVGQTYKNQVKLLSADSHAAKFLIDGKVVNLGIHQSPLGHAITGEQSPQLKSVSIPRNNHGMYLTSGSINGFPVTFLVDTGASSVAMNEATAKQIGLQYKLKGKKIIVSTAAGRVKAWNLIVDKVSVGTIQLSHIEATVVRGVGPSEVLLGNSFLKRLKLQDSGNLLKLSTKF